MSKKDTLVLVLLLVFTIGSAAAYFMWDKISGTIGGEEDPLGLKEKPEKPKATLAASASLSSVAQRIHDVMIKLNETITNVAHHIQFAEFMGPPAQSVASKIDKEWRANGTYAKKEASIVSAMGGFEISRGSAELLMILGEMVKRGYIEEEVRNCVRLAFMARDGSSRYTSEDWITDYSKYITLNRS